MENIDWKDMPFGYIKTDYNARCVFKDGAWGDIVVSDSDYIPIHIAATALHYGQESFEGLKAYRGKDGKVRLFRWEENVKRMQRSAEGILMEPIPSDIFFQAVTKVVKLNERFVPPHGTGASLYVRPVLFGSGPEVGVKPSKEYTFIVFVTPVGPYFKHGFKPMRIAIERESDRSAPLGTGNLKVGGNYAASLRGDKKIKSLGFSSALYLDSSERKYVDEIGAANFFGIKNNTYITPKSSSILCSITNMSLMDLAKDIGLSVEQRPIPVEELDSFDEVGACGTAAVIAPISEIADTDEGKSFYYCKDGNPGEVSTKLYETLVGIQYGDIEDKHGWITIVE